MSAFVVFPWLAQLDRIEQKLDSLGVMLTVIKQQGDSIMQGTSELVADVAELKNAVNASVARMDDNFQRLMDLINAAAPDQAAIDQAAADIQAEIDILRAHTESDTPPVPPPVSP